MPQIVEKLLGVLYISAGIGLYMQHMPLLWMYVCNGIISLALVMLGIYVFCNREVRDEYGN